MEKTAIEKFSSMLLGQFEQEGVSFSISGESLSNEEVCAKDGLLSLFLYKASEVNYELFQKRWPLLFEKNSEALMDFEPVLEEDGNFIAWVHALHYGAEEEIRRYKREKKMINGLIPLDDLYKKWHESMRSQVYPYRAKPQTTSNPNNNG